MPAILGTYKVDSFCKSAPLPLARQLSPSSRVPVQPVPRVVIVSLEFLVTGVIDFYQEANFEIIIYSL